MYTVSWGANWNVGSAIRFSLAEPLADHDVRDAQLARASPRGRPSPRLGPRCRPRRSPRPPDCRHRRPRGQRSRARPATLRASTMVIASVRVRESVHSDARYAGATLEVGIRGRCGDGLTGTARDRDRAVATGLPMASSRFHWSGGTGMTLRRDIRTRPSSANAGSALTAASVTGSSSRSPASMSTTASLGSPPLGSGYGSDTIRGQADQRLFVTRCDR